MRQLTAVTLYRSFALAAACLVPQLAEAQLPFAPAQQQSPTPGDANSAEPEGPGPGFTTNLFAPSRTTLLGDAFGVRSYLGRYGISLGLTETSEVFGNATGGIRRGATYNGLTIMSLGLDTQKAFGWDGGTFNVSALQIHGRNLSAENLGNLNTSSGIQATRATRLWELWYQQSFLDGRLDVKLGQQSLDQEFIGSQGASLFINTMMGWPVVPSYDLYAGGPAYPLSSLGVRLRARLTPQVTGLIGVFDDNPPGGPFYDDSQVRGASQSGTRFNTRTGALIIGELQFAVNQPAEGQVVREGQSQGLPGVYKIGGWYDTAKFYDQRIDTAGLSLADPDSTGLPRFRRKNWSIYGTADQTVWRPDPDEPMSLGVFARIMGAPGDRNLVSLGVNAGVVLRAPFKGRDNDSVGLAYGYAGVGRSASLLDKDAVLQSGVPGSARSGESFIELTYQYQVAPWWQVQPDFQYIFLPGGGVPNPSNPGKRIGNEAIFGLRTNITF
jgi:porin